MNKQGFNKLFNSLHKLNRKKNVNESELFCVEVWFDFDDTMARLTFYDDPIDVNLLFEFMPEQKLYLANAKFKEEKETFRIYRFGTTTYLISKCDYHKFDEWRETNKKKD
jgi:hypothetical protein